MYKLIQDVKKGCFESSYSSFPNENMEGSSFTIDLSIDSRLGLSSKIVSQLPDCQVLNLVEIRERLMTVNPITKESFASFLLADSFKYVLQLVNLSIEIESLDVPSMQVIADIWKCIFYLNDLNVVEILLKENVFLHVAGGLEYDKSLVCKGNYREFLTAICKHKRVAAQMSDEVCQLSTKLFQLKFLKDYMLRPAIDESGVGALNSIIMSTTENICTLAFNDLLYIESVLSVMCGNKHNIIIGNSTTTVEPSQARIDALRFLRELFQLSRQLQFEKRVDLYKNMLNRFQDVLFTGLCEIFNDFESLSEERICAAEILVSVVIISPEVLRKFIMQGTSPLPPSSFGACHNSNGSKCDHFTNSDVSLNQKSFLFVILQSIVEDTEPAVIEQLGDALKVLLDSERMDKNEKSEFLGVFYDYYIIWLVSPLLEPNIPYKQCQMCCNTPNRRNFIVQDLASISTSRRVMFDILCLCVQSHSYRMRYFIMRNGILSRCLRILESPQRHFYLGVIKLFRTIVSGNDEFYVRHIVKFNILGPLLDILHQLGTKDNLVTSAIIEFVEYIRLENVALLVAYIAERHSNCFENLNHDCFDKLKLKFDQNLDKQSENLHNDPSILNQLEKFRKLNEMEMEEDYLLNDCDDQSSLKSKDDFKSNSLKALSDCYGTDDDSLFFSHDISDSQAASNEKSILHSISNAYSVVDTGIRPFAADYQEPSLPPLKSKFEIDDSTDDNIFVQKSMHSKSKIEITGSIIINGNVHHNGDVDVKETCNGANGISFSMKKRKVGNVLQKN